jgi:uncharacterized protein (TIGR02118 family)
VAKLVVLYKHPPDVVEFERYYFSVHAPIAKKVPGLKSMEVSRRPIVSPLGTQYFFAAIMDFESIEALDRAMKSPEGQAAASDVANFAPAGADILIVDTKSI